MLSPHKYYTTSVYDVSVKVDKEYTLIIYVVSYNCIRAFFAQPFMLYSEVNSVFINSL